MNKSTINYFTEILPMTRLTLGQKEKLLKELKTSHHSSLAALVREKLFSREITPYDKQKIDVLQQLADFRTELKRVGTNVNQIAKMMNTFKTGQLLDSEVTLLEHLLGVLLEINEHLDDIIL